MADGLYTMYGLKCFTAAAMPRASTSHGSHVTWCCFSFTLKKLATTGLLSWLMYKVAPIPCCLTDPSVTIHSWSSDVRSWTLELVSSKLWASLKVWSNGSGHWSLSWEGFPATAISSGAKAFAQPGITRLRTLKAPRKARSARTVIGGSHAERVAMRWGLARREPWRQIHPRMTVDFGATTVLVADRWMSHLASALRTLRQFCRSSCRELPPTYMSSAILATQPSWTKSPRIRHISSSSAVSEPGIPMADLLYTKVPLKGVATPQYFIDDLLRGIW